MAGPPPQDHQDIEAFYKVAECYDLEDGDQNYFTQGIEGLEKVFAQFENKSSGWSARWRNLSKKDMVEKYPKEVARIVLARILLRACYGSEMKDMTPFELVNKGLVDPRENFVKPESHPGRKKKKKTWRLIWCAGLIDACIQGLFFVFQNKQDILRYQDGVWKSSLPSDFVACLGLGHDDKGVEHFGETLSATFDGGAEVEGEDARGWDLTVERPDLLGDGSRRTLNIDESKHPGLSAGIMQEAYCNSAHVAVFGTKVYEICKLGITASGVFSTGAQNCFVRLKKAAACGAKKGVAVGDDLLYQGKIDADRAKARSVVPKEDSYHKAPIQGPHDFTSHWFTRESAGWVAKFQNLAKSVARMHFEGCTPESLGGVLYAVRKDEAQTALLMKIARHEGWDVETAKDFVRPHDTDDF